MFKIARQQMAELVETSVRNYEKRVVSQIGKQFPTGCFPGSQKQLLDMVQQGIQRAAIRKITSEKHVAKFIALANALGQEFDMDPKLEWADEMLDKLTNQNASEVFDALSQQAADYLIAKSGVDPQVVEVAKALVAAARPDDEQFSEKAEVGDPVAPCPKSAPRRLYSFSS